jgi:hypothetical protein
MKVATAAPDEAGAGAMEVIGGVALGVAGLTASLCNCDAGAGADAMGAGASFRVATSGVAGIGEGASFLAATDGELPVSAGRGGCAGFTVPTASNGARTAARISSTRDGEWSVSDGRDGCAGFTVPEASNDGRSTARVSSTRTCGDCIAAASCVLAFASGIAAGRSAKSVAFSADAAIVALVGVGVCTTDP